MPRRTHRQVPPTGPACFTMAAMAWLTFWTHPAAAQAAQRVGLTGTVWPRCWVSRDAEALTHGSPLERVRCTTQRSSVLVSRDQGQFQLCAAHRRGLDACDPGANVVAERVTVTPRS